MPAASQPRFTRAAVRTTPLSRRRAVWSVQELTQAGVTRSAIAANLAARRWRRCGRAIVLHAGPPTSHQRWRAALITCGPGTMLTAFTAAEFAGLTGWQRQRIHVLGPPGARDPRPTELPIRLHRTADWPVPPWRGTRCQPPADALLVAAATFASPRPAAGLLAAAVQQGIVTGPQLLASLERARRVRHRSLLVAATHDIIGGAQALSEIDFGRLCRLHGLPLPERQAVRRDSTGRRRYLDAVWRQPGGGLLVAEVDGAVHLNPRRWWDDQFRQNELALDGAVVLRFPSVIVRTQPGQVVAQLRRALGCR